MNPFSVLIYFILLNILILLGPVSSYRGAPASADVKDPWEMSLEEFGRTYIFKDSEVSFSRR